MTTLPQVSLRAPEPADLDLIFNLEEDPRLWEAGTSLAPVSRYMLQRYLEDYRADFTGEGQLRMVAVDADGNAIGLVDMFEYDKLNRRAGVGIAVLPERRKQGYGTAMLVALCRYGRRRFLLHNLWAHTAVDNIGAIRTFEDSGFARVGVLKGWTLSPDGFKDAVLWQRELDKDNS